MLSYSAPVAVSSDQLAEYMGLGLEIAAEAGSEILPYFRAPISVINKRTDGRFDPVTEADRAAEAVIRARLSDRLPDHGIFGEEFGHESGNGLTWVIDPIDGTRAFMTGMLHWGVLLALFDGEKPILGIMHQPYTGEFFFGDNLSAHYRRGDETRRLATRSAAAVEEAILTTTSPRLLSDPEERAGFDRLEAAVKLSKYGGDCYIYAMLAMGYVDIALDGSLQPYDIQAIMPIIRGAGGVVTTASGGDASMGGFVVAAGSREVHAQALKYLQG